MERMISAHLMWSLKSQGLLSKKQCGFRKNYSMLGPFVHFETIIRNTFVKKEHVLTIFFDILTIFCTTTQHGSTVFWQTSGVLVSEAISPGLFRASCLNSLSRSEWVPLCQSCRSRIGGPAR